ncbi:haloalkane dehalogenase (plasmid) [Burkholderia sp. PAMC 26561]|nr:haloalkane dehalogenase [Burkholderia sp. PAMC 26561]AME27722.1 haloalkane dehalogenase [Burkholderia sp. PAMC 26561]
MDQFPKEKRFATIHGKRMAYIEHGEGDPIVFLHGNPTSSYLWRNIMPYLQGRGKLIAPDLIGMGDSDKLEESGPDRYSYVEHRHFLFALLESLNVREKVTLILHDWGSALGFHWAHQHASAMKGIAFMEAIVGPFPTWDDFPENGRTLFQRFRSDAGDDMILNENTFIDVVLRNSVLRGLTDAEMTEYRRPYLMPGEDRRTMLSWPRQLPIEGSPADVVSIVKEYGTWLASSKVPKLFVNAEPGAMLTGALRDFVRTWPCLSEFTVAGVHYVQEDSPDEIGNGIAHWLDKIDTSIS